MAQDEIKVIWQAIKNRFFPRVDVGSLLYNWVLGTVFVVPLLIFNYGLNASVIRQLALFILVAVGWLIWAGQAILGKQKIVWKRTVFGPIALALLAVVILVSLSANDLLAVWGWRGGWGESNPWGWLAVIGLGVLITQVVDKRKQNFGISEFRQFSKNSLTEILKFRNSELLLKSYLLSSTLLALFIVIWWGINQELVMPALTSFAAASLFFTVNAIIIAALSLLARGKIKIFWLAILLVNLLAIFVYDYDVAWYLLGAVMLALSLGQLFWEKKLERVDFITPFVLIGLSLVLLFVPVGAVSEKLGFSAIGGPASGWDNSVGVTVSYPRFFQHATWREKLLGAGLGQGTESFWEKAELVDMRQVRQWPPLGNLWGGWLWEGGMLLILVWLGSLAGLAHRMRRLTKKAAVRDLQFIFTLTIGLIAALAATLLLPFDWLVFFGFIILAALAAAPSPEQKYININSSQGSRAFLFMGMALLAALTLLLIFFTARQIKSRLDFFESIKVGNAQTGTTVDLKLLDGAIKRSPSVYGYRLARIDLMAQALQEKATKELDAEAAEVKPLLASLAEDYDYLAGRNLSGASWWQLGSRAEAIARALGQEAAAPWFKRASGAYEKAVEKLRRNVIFLTDAARFYRQQAISLPPEDNANKDKIYQHAQELADKALAIDDTYEPAYGEKAELLVLLGKTEEAYDIMKNLADNSPSAAYSAARLAFSAKKFDEAATYYKKAITQNPNHLQARYELVQVYVALSDFKSAGAELDELEKRAPQDDVATQELLKNLRELLKQ